VATEEVGIRLSLQGRREMAVGLSDTSKELERVEDSAKEIEGAGKDAARGLEKASDRRFAGGFAKIHRGAAGLAGFLGRGLVTAAKAGAVALGAATVAAGALSVKAIGLAADSAETGSAFKTVLGPAARGVQKDLDRLTKRFGTYNPALQSAATGFAVMGKAAGKNKGDLRAFSTDLVRAGLDLESFWNIDKAQVFKSLQSGLVGESEPLKKFGIQMSQAALDAFALEQGMKKSTKEMTEQEKIALRQAFILGNLGDAHGDLARTQESYANQQRKLGDRWKTFLDVLGGPMMTAGTGAFQGLNSIAGAGIRLLRQNLPAVEAHAQRLSEKFATLGKTWAQDPPGAIDTLMSRWDTLKASFSGFSTSGTGKQLGTLGDNLATLGPAFKALADSGIENTLIVTNVVTGYLADNVDTLAKYMPWLVTGFVALKVAQMAANVATVAGIALRGAELVTSRQLLVTNRALVASLGVETNVRKRVTIATMAHTVATKGLAGAQRVLNFVMSKNPLAIVIKLLAVLAAGVVLAYKKSSTFRGIVDALWSSVKTAGKCVGDLALKAGQFLLKWSPLGIAVRAVKNNFDAVGSSVGWVTDKLKSAWDWIGRVAEKAKSLPGAGLLGDAAGFVGNTFGGARANGGPVRPGATYRVGENGPEWFSPRVTGVITPELPRLSSESDNDDAVPTAAVDGSGRPLVVQLVADGKMMTEQVVGTLRGQLARA
jgi:hypothetical protein